MNAKLRVAEELGVQPWPTWQVFVKVLKAQVKPLLKEERVREQIRKLVPTANVDNYIYRFCELQN